MKLHLIPILTTFLLLSACASHKPNPTVSIIASATVSIGIQSATAISSSTTAPSTPTPSIVPSSPPSPTSLPEIEEQLTSGDNHTCRLHPDRTISCWGWNQFGQAGQLPVNTTVAETSIESLSGISQISAGAYHTCAVDSQGQVMCWGRNNNGQLGDGTEKDHFIPGLVQSLEGISITQISAGAMHTCAVDTSGSVWCWGSNRDGKLGTGSDKFINPLPEKVTGLPNPVDQVASGSTYTCALDNTRNIWCWGDGAFGEIGLQPFKGSSTPVKVTTVPDKVLTFQAGWFHTCYLTENGIVSCWGKNQEGELGNASNISLAEPVSPVAMDKDVRLMAAGGQETCTVKNDDQVYCWGRNNYSQIGDHTRVDRLIPVAVTLPEKISQLTVGGSFACALGKSGETYCWGADDLRQAGDFSINPTITPTISETSSKSTGTPTITSTPTLTE
jgi:alpha-tubulin suppressor-like RCC1 family protein